jgi:hypothetical protein
MDGSRVEAPRVDARPRLVQRVPPQRLLGQRSQRLLGRRDRSAYSGAAITAPAYLNLDAVSLERARRPARRLKLDALVWQAQDAAALVAHKVRVVRLGVSLLLDAQIKAPNVITEVRATDEAGLREIRQVPINSRAIPALRGEPLSDLRVTLRRRDVEQASQHSDARRGRPKPDAADSTAQIVKGGGDRRLRHIENNLPLL